MLQGLADARAGAAAATAALGACALAGFAILLKAFVWSQAPPMRTLIGLAAATLVAGVFRTGAWGDGRGATQPKFPLHVGNPHIRVNMHPRFSLPTVFVLAPANMLLQLCRCCRVPAAAAALPGLQPAATGAPCRCGSPGHAARDPREGRLGAGGGCHRTLEVPATLQVQIGSGGHSQRRMGSRLGVGWAMHLYSVGIRAPLCILALERAQCIIRRDFDVKYLCLISYPSTRAGLQDCVLVTSALYLYA
jgi:hypothetical protein